MTPALTLLSLLLLSTSLDEGVRALSEFRLDEAIQHLEAAQHEGRQSYDDRVLVHEQLGIAYAYKGREAEAIATFERLLLLDPTHALRYNLSPKATLPFEQARERVKSRPPLAIDVLWPRDADPTESLPLTLEVVSDPAQLLESATIHWRRRGDSEYRRIDLALDGGRGRASLSAPEDPPDADLVDLIFVVGRDKRGNEVLKWADERRPREILLRYHPPALYERWWVWVLAGVILAGGSAATYALTRPGSITYDLEVHR